MATDTEWTDNPDQNLDALLYARHAEINTLADLEMQRGTPIPALFNTFYKFVQNPSSVSVETFKRMVDTDDTIGSGVDFLTTSLAARIGRYEHPSKEITEWINRALEQIEGGWQNAIKELLSATWAGFSVQEKVYGNDPELGFIIKKLVTLPPSTLLFETERTGEITSDGILQYQRNYNPAMSAGGVSYLFGFGMNAMTTGNLRPDPYAKVGDFPFPLRTGNVYTYLSIRIPRAKVVHYAFDAQGKFGNPYGRSLLRRCYKYYVTKDAVLQMLATALDRKGTPLTLVWADSNASIMDTSKVADGENAKGQRGKGIRADVAARQAFSKIHNDSVMILPGKKGQVYDVEALTQGSNATDFLEALRFCNQSIMRALLLPSLVFTNGDGTGSYSLGQEHARTFDKICDGILSGFKHVLLEQVVKQMLQLNFPKASWEKDGLGSFNQRELTLDEIDKELASLEKAVNIGAIDMNDLTDLNAVRERLGFQAKTELPERPDPFAMEEQPNAEQQADESAAPSSDSKPGIGEER